MRSIKWRDYHNIVITDVLLILIFLILAIVKYFYLPEQSAAFDLIIRVYKIGVLTAICVMGMLLVTKKLSFKKFCALSGVFVISQYWGIQYYCKLTGRLWIPFEYSEMIDTILTTGLYSVPYICFVLIYLIRSEKNRSVQSGLTGLGIFLSMPLLCATCSFLFGNIVQTINQGQMSAVYRFLLTFYDSPKSLKDAALTPMNFLMGLSKVIQLIYRISTFAGLFLLGTRLLRGKSDIQKYLGLTGGFYISQYIGISFYEKFLDLFMKEYGKPKTLMPYRITCFYNHLFACV
jgi:hypothetical protein